jgi:RNA polymerase sigma factor (sigma-70 family)
MANVSGAERARTPWDDLTRLLEEGNCAAGLSATERAGEFHYAFTLNAEVLVTAEYSGERSVITLVEVLDRAARGKLPSALSAPPGEHLLYLALGALPVRDGVVLGLLQDDTGAARGPLSQVKVPAKQAKAGTTATFGERLTQAVLATKTDAKARVQTARAGVNRAANRDRSDDVAAVVAATAAEKFADEGARWSLVRACKAQGHVVHLASSREFLLDEEELETIGRTRRSHMFEVMLAALAMDAGTTRHQYRGQPVKIEQAELGDLEDKLYNPLPDRPGTHRPAPESMEHDEEALVDSLGLIDLIERAKLTERQREVLKLYLGGRSFAEIASELGITAATARVTLHNAQNRIREIT